MYELITDKTLAEYEAFLHILNSASGVVREKLDDLFGTSLSRAERDTLATLIYYPKEKLEEISQTVDDLRENRARLGV